MKTKFLMAAVSAALLLGSMQAQESATKAVPSATQQGCDKLEADCDS